MFDDELRAFDWAKEKYTQEIHRDINDQRTATEDGAPYLYVPENAGDSRAPLGIVLVMVFSPRRRN